MIRLFSDVGLADLRRFVAADTLFAFDLDGTLAPIVAEPTAILVSGEVRELMRRLSKLAVTAVITGRARKDALAYLGFEPRYLVGNHGAEGMPGRDGEGRELFRMVEGWERQLAVLLKPQVQQATLFESKGSTLSLHYRHAPDPQAVHAALLDAIAKLEPAPRRIGGKFVENLIPHGAPHKGDALLHLLDCSGCGTAFFIGDDETDEDVFRLDDPRIFPVCVGLDRPTAARYALESQEEMEALLRELVAMLELDG